MKNLLALLGATLSINAFANQGVYDFDFQKYFGEYPSEFTCFNERGFHPRGKLKWNKVFFCKFPTQENLEEIKDEFLAGATERHNAITEIDQYFKNAAENFLEQAGVIEADAASNAYEKTILAEHNSFLKDKEQYIRNAIQGPRGTNLNTVLQEVGPESSFLSILDEMRDIIQMEESDEKNFAFYELLYNHFNPLSDSSFKAHMISAKRLVRLGQSSSRLIRSVSLHRELEYSKSCNKIVPKKSITGDWGSYHYKPIKELFTINNARSQEGIEQIRKIMSEDKGVLRVKCKQIKGQEPLDLSYDADNHLLTINFNYKKSYHFQNPSLGIVSGQKNGIIGNRKTVEIPEQKALWNAIK